MRRSVIQPWRAPSGPGALPEVLATLDEASRTVPLRIVGTERNLGFGPAVMRGAREAQGRLWVGLG